MKNQNELYHYGVKGMQWGVRKSPEEMLADIRKSFEGMKNKASNAISSKIMGLKMKSLSKQIGKGSKLASKVMSSSINKTTIANGKKINYSVKKATSSSKVKAATGGKVGGSAKLTINKKSNPLEVNRVENRPLARPKNIDGTIAKEDWYKKRKIK